MMASAPEFSRPVLLARLGTTPLSRDIEADANERAALAKRFSLLSIERLSAAVELARRGTEMVLLRASFAAEFVQECVVTLDPVPGTISAEFALLYGPPALEETAMGVAGDETAFEPLLGDAIDIGEAVAQEFSLLLPPFPRSPAAEADEAAAAAGAADDDSPFAALARWRDPSAGGER